MTTPVALALDGLADLVGRVALEDAVDRERTVLADLVVRLEEAAAAGLGTTDGEPPVVLVRRFARAHRLLTHGTPAPGVHVEEVCHLTRLLRDSRQETTAPLGRSAAAVPVGS
ncbi:hypothetical protein [Aquipuribacter sp. SD81]|uniref:hypothetical protein n=1 Tax=Aquipuribacter sp. SD81 TaxID=3127703 RepID=UPI00301B2542